MRGVLENLDYGPYLSTLRKVGLSSMWILLVDGDHSTHPPETRQHYFPPLFLNSPLLLPFLSLAFFHPLMSSLLVNIKTLAAFLCAVDIHQVCSSGNSPILGLLAGVIL